MPKMTHKGTGHTTEVVDDQVAMYRTQGWTEKQSGTSSTNAAEKRVAKKAADSK
jgi:hypothetical protein